MHQDNPANGRTPLAVYLGCLFGSQPAGFIELRVKREGGGMTQNFFEVGDLERVAIETLAAGKCKDAYLGVLPRTRRAGTADAVEQGHVAYIDVDGDRQRLRDFPVRPSLVVGTGSGCHAYWSLTDPAPAGAIERVNRRLADHLGGDVRATDRARILRPPGTRNFKRAEPRPVELLYVNVEVYTLEQLGAHLPPEEPETQPRTGRSAGRGRQGTSDDPLLRVTPAEYVEALTGRQVGRDGKVACPFHDDRTPSMHVYETPAEGVHCFGCGRGSGSIYDFASEVAGIGTRGEDFKQLRSWIAHRLLNTPVAT